MENYKIPQSKILHMHGVAEYMSAHAEERGLNPEDMYILGLLHDIGYYRGKSLHEESGREMADNAFCSDYSSISKHIAYHSMSPQRYVEICMDEPPKELVLLWEADMRVNSNGQLVTYEDRLRDIAERYGLDSEEYMVAKDTIDWLRD